MDGDIRIMGALISLEHRVFTSATPPPRQLRFPISSHCEDVTCGQTTAGNTRGLSQVHAALRPRGRVHCKAPRI
eukprot:1106342-Prymnesium_polylepis.1